MSTSPKSPDQKAYTALNWFMTSVISTVVMALVIVGRHEFMNVRHPATLFLAPAVAGLCLALGNFRVLHPSALLAMPLSFGICLAVSLTGLFLMQGQQLGGQFIGLDLLVEHLPALLGSWFLYRIYASLSGGMKAAVFLLVLVFVQACAFALFRDYDVLKLEVVFYSGLIALLSLNHFGRPSKVKE
jgi:hypothetical protein